MEQSDFYVAATHSSGYMMETQNRNANRVPGGGSPIDIPGVTWTATPTATTKASRKTHASSQLAPAASNLLTGLVVSTTSSLLVPNVAAATLTFTLRPSPVAVVHVSASWFFSPAMAIDRDIVIISFH